MSEPNTSIKGKIFLLVIILFACIGIIPITLYSDEITNNTYVVKKKRKSTNKIAKKHKASSNPKLNTKQAVKLIPLDEVQSDSIKNGIDLVTDVTSTAATVPNVAAAVPNVAATVPNVAATVPNVAATVPNVAATLPNVVGSSSDVVGAVSDIVGLGLTTDDNMNDVQPFEEVLPEEEYQIIDEEEDYTIPNKKIKKRIVDRIIPNHISEEERINNVAYEPSIIEEELQPIGSNELDTEFNLLSEIDIMSNDIVQPGLDENIIPNNSGSNNITDINFPSLKIINDTSYLNNINISSKSDVNTNQIGIWYASPTTFLKITDTIAKLYIQTVSSTIIPSVIGYDPVYPGGIFISKNFIKYKDNAIEFKYDSNQNIIELQYTNSQTNKKHTIELTKLSNKICKKVLHKIKKTSISPESTTLFLEVLN